MSDEKNREQPQTKQHSATPPHGDKLEQAMEDVVERNLPREEDAKVSKDYEKQGGV